MATFCVTNTQSCGVLELSNISAHQTPADVVRATVKHWLNYDGSQRAFITFNGVVAPRQLKYDERFHADRDDNYGQALADYITSNGLGTVTASQTAVNQRSGNTMQIWIWAPDWDALIAHYNKAAA